MLTVTSTDNMPLADKAPQTQEQKQPIDEDKAQAPTSTTTTAPNVAAAPKRNDDSNPQQGTGPTTTTKESPPSPKPQTAATHAPILQRPSLKIPPTAKDDRKLFVGGLPSDGK